MNGKKQSLDALRTALREANVRGRSQAKTREQLELMCSQHNLLGMGSRTVSSDEHVGGGEKFATLPPDMVYEVCDKIASHGVTSLEEILEKAVHDTIDTKMSRAVIKRAEQTTQTLLALRGVDKTFATILHPDSEYWHKMLDIFLKCSDLHAREAHEAATYVTSRKLSRLRALLLVTVTGCELCGAKQIRKVTWPFMVRCCQDCLHSMTISDYRIKERFLVNPDEEFQDFPSVSATLYARRVGSYTLRFFLKSHVLRLLRDKHGQNFESLEGAYQYIHRDRLEEERAVAERNEALLGAVINQLRTSLTKDAEVQVQELERGGIARVRIASKAFDAACKKPSAWKAYDDDAPNPKKKRKTSVCSPLQKMVNECVLYVQNQNEIQVRNWVYELAYEQGLSNIGVESEFMTKLREVYEYDGQQNDAGTIPFITHDQLRTDIWPALLSGMRDDALLRKYLTSSELLKIFIVNGQVSSNAVSAILAAINDMKNDNHDDARKELTSCEQIQQLLTMVLSSKALPTIIRALNVKEAPHDVLNQLIFDRKTYTFTCPCGRKGLKSLDSVISHVRDSYVHKSLK